MKLAQCSSGLKTGEEKEERERGSEREGQREREKERERVSWEKALTNFNSLGI